MPMKKKATRKRPRSRSSSPIEFDVVILPSDKQRCSTDPAVLALSEDIEKFDKNRKRFIQGLSLNVHSNKQAQIRWFKTLKKAWKDTPPKSPLAATRLVWDMLKKVHPNRVDLADILGILEHYGLPSHYHVLIEDRDKDASKSDNQKGVLTPSDDQLAQLKYDDEFYGNDSPPSPNSMWDDEDLPSSSEE